MADLEGLHDTRALLGRALETLGRIRMRVPGLASAMSWRSRAADEFGDALAEWSALLQRIDHDIERWDGVLAGREARILAGIADQAERAGP
jgi:hypothetical protein